MRTFLLHAFFAATCFWNVLGLDLHAAPVEKAVRIGFTTPLTGDAAPAGNEMRNAALLANEFLANNQLEIIFEDERCLGAPAASAARKLVSIDRINYAVGFFCNVALLTAAPIYVKAGVPVLSVCATTMTTPDVGADVYRLFPADQLAVPVLHRYLADNFQRIGILAEEDAYAQMLADEFVKLNSSSEKSLSLERFDYPFESTDLRPLLLKLKAKKIDALFISSATDATFIRIVRQMSDLKFHPQIGGIYVPASDIARKELGALIDGAVAVTLPALDKRADSKEMQRLFSEYVRRFGKPASGFPVVATTFEAIRLIQIARTEQRPIQEVVKDDTVLTQSFIGPYTLDRYGALRGIEFELRKIGLEGSELLEHQVP